MAQGADTSGEPLETGRVNRAESATILEAQRTFGEDAADNFNGSAILLVQAAPHIDDDDDFRLVSDGQDVHGLMSSGCGAGAGVVGFSRSNPIFAPGVELTIDDFERSNSAGVFGKGVTGVVGQGDNRGVNIASTPGLRAGFGAGVIGRGGDGKGGCPTAGVMGFAGQVTVEVSGGETGVFGLDETGVTGLGTIGAGVKGTGGGVSTGVLGIGGAGTDGSGNPTQGTGVVGIGNAPALFAPADETVGTGVLGAGRDGVRGIGLNGRGGIFQADERTAQVQLLPVKAHTIKERPQVNNLVQTFPELPERGQMGDLMSIVDDLGQCTLWFCVGQNPVSGGAKWAQVGLGEVFDGTS